MSEFLINATDFIDLALQVFKPGYALRFQARGGSMHPFIHDGDWLEVHPVGGEDLRLGDLVLCQINDRCVVAHRIVMVCQVEGSRALLLQGDANATPDGLFFPHRMMGRVLAIDHNGRRFDLDTLRQRFVARLLARSIFRSLYRVLVACRRRAGMALRFLKGTHSSV